MKEWSAREACIIRANWTKLADRELAKLTDRTVDSVRSYRQRVLGLRYPSPFDRWRGDSGRKLTGALVHEYVSGASQSALCLKYGVFWRKLRGLLIAHDIPIREKSQQAFLEKYGRQPRIRQGLTRWKLYIIFSMLGDNLRPSSQAARGTHIIGIAAGGDVSFAEEWIRNFEREYRVRPNLSVRGSHDIQAHISSFDVWRDLHRYAIFGRRNWKLSNRALRHLFSRKVAIRKLGYGLKGFFDAEGSVKYQRRRASRQVTVSSVNSAGLSQISSLLRKLGIQHGIYGDTISIFGRSNLENFQTNVGFSIPRKNEALKSMISSFKGYKKE